MTLTSLSTSATGTVSPSVVANPSAESPFVELSPRVEFNMHDAYYQHATADHFWIQWRFAVLSEMIQRYEIEGKLGPNVFEVGCGNGVVQQQFERLVNVPVLGCDLNYRAMEMALPTLGERFLYNVYDRRPEWNRYFDSILLLDVVEHIDTPVDFLKAVAGHLKPDGHLIINVPATPWLYSRYDAVQGHVRRYTKERLASELSAAKLELVASRYWGSSVVPIAALRKILVRFADDDQVLTRGFAPPSRLAERFLRMMMRAELAGLGIPQIGTSLAAIVRQRRT